MLVPELITLASQLGQALLANKSQIAMAESCTGGLVAAALTEIPGSSAWFERGFVTYSNSAKMELLGVAADTLDAFGAVSQETAEAMVQGVLVHSHADLALAITGIAGPGGGTAAKPVGTVYIAWANKYGRLACERFSFSGDRQQVRQQAASHALSYLIKTGWL